MARKVSIVDPIKATDFAQLYSLVASVACGPVPKDPCVHAGTS